MVGLGPGALAVLAFWPGAQAPPLVWVQGGALAGGVLLLLAASLLARQPHDEPDRGAHFARAASAGLVALPALAAALLGLSPGPRASFAAVLVLLAVALFAATRRRAPAGGLAGQLGAASGALLGGTAAILLAGGLSAALRAGEPEYDDATRNAVLDHDARTDTVALPACAPRAERVDVIAHAGAHPRLAPGGGTLWFDAQGPDGRRQIHRLARASGELACVTCDEPGNNRRPAPGPGGVLVAFDTDRHARWRHPGDTEIHLLNASTVRRGVHSRRMTWTPGPDEWPLFAPGSETLVWSRGEAGRYRLVSASLRTGHGALQLGRAGTLREGGAEWLAPLGWSPDARTLAVARGNPLGPARVDALDPGSGERVSFPAPASGAGALSFNADGGWYALATSRRASVAGLLPGRLGFVLAPLASAWDDGDPARFQGSEVRWGPTRGEARTVDLGETAGWGWPTGIALEADATGFVLGQRRTGPEGFEERLVSVKLDCS